MLKRNRRNRLAKFNSEDLVRVRSAKSIYHNLDSLNKRDGCLFMNQMIEYCGQQFKILKVVNNFFDEYRNKMFKTKSPLYILDGLTCDGQVESFEQKCDRTCYFFWHEEWLEKP